MKIAAIYFMLFLCLVLISCTGNESSTTEKYQYKRNNIVNVSDKIVDVKTDFVFGSSVLFALDSFLIVDELSTNLDKGVDLFNMNTFKYITSTGIRGQGPGELTQAGFIGIDHKNKILWLTDDGKQLIYKCPLDSILHNVFYKPTVSVKLKTSLYLTFYDFYNDSIVYGKACEALSYDKAVDYMAKANFNTDSTIKYGYEHPKLIPTKTSINASSFRLVAKNNLYINAFYYCDLLTICNLDGSLKYNIYGPNAFAHITHGDYAFYYGVEVLGNYIIAGYVNDVGLVTDKVRGKEGNMPTKFLVFDMDGNYIETLETGNKFSHFCVDQANNRIICYFEDRENPLGYINFNLK